MKLIRMKSFCITGYYQGASIETTAAKNCLLAVKDRIWYSLCSRNTDILKCMCVYMLTKKRIEEEETN